MRARRCPRTSFADDEAPRTLGLPRCFFDIHDGINVTDNVGQELADLEAAKAEGIRIAGGFATRPTMLGGDGGAVNVVIRTAPNVIAMTIRLVFNVEVPREGAG